MPRTYFVYVLASETHELYVGVTGNLVKRVNQHRTGASPDGYPTRHRTTHLVYCESTQDILAAITREKQIKGWTRQKKLDLIATTNPDWKDFAAEW